MKGLEAVRALYRQGRYAGVRRGCYIALWDNIHQPEALYYLANSLDKLGETDQAAVYYHLTERELAEGSAGESVPNASQMRQVCEARLKVVDTTHQEEVKEYAAAASGSTTPPTSTRAPSRGSRTSCESLMSFDSTASTSMTTG